MQNARIRFLSIAIASSLVASVVPGAVAAPSTLGDGHLLSDPFLQAPQVGSVNVAWFSHTPGTKNVIVTGEVAELSVDNAVDAASGEVAGVQVHEASTIKLSRMYEDAASFVDNPPAAGIVERDVYRHEGTITGIRKTEQVPYRVISLDGDTVAMSEMFRAQDAFEADEPVSMLLTSDHQQKDNAPANLQLAAETIGNIDVALVAGDLVNVPDRASEWFDHNGGLAFFDGMQGNANYTSENNGQVYDGGQIAQNAVMYPVIGNHEIQGRMDGRDSLDTAFNYPVPREVAEAEYDRLGITEDRETWVENNSFSTTSYEEIFTLPESTVGGEKYYATSIGNTRLISLYSTRIWRGTEATEEPAERESISRYYESPEVLDQPLERGYGEFIFEDIGVDSDQYRWLQQELASSETTSAEHVIVMMHESPISLGNNSMPHFSDPVEHVEKDENGDVVGIYYTYPEEGNVLLNSVLPLIDQPGTPVDLVFNGHSHLWNRFQSPNGVNYMETSNVGNSYGARHELSADGPRPVPAKDSQRWDAKDYLEYGVPGGFEPIVPTVDPQLAANDPTQPAPYVASNQYSVFTGFDSETGIVRSWLFDGSETDPEVILFDEFQFGTDATQRPAEQMDEPTPTGSQVPGSSTGGVLAVIVAILALIGVGVAAFLNGGFGAQLKALLP